MKKILFLTNGHGEDLVAAELIRRLKGKAGLTALPLVGTGSAFAGLPVEVIGRRQALPSGGFSLRNFWFLLRDLSSGLLGATHGNLRLLKSLRGQFDLVVAIGDIVPIIAALAVRAPLIFVGVNKSDYYRWFGYTYTPWEKWLLKKYAKRIFVRDQLTADNLNKQGLKAEYLGNPLMDCIALPLTPHSPSPLIRGKGTGDRGEAITTTIALLPGTRADAKLNLEDFEAVIAELITLKDPDTMFHFTIATKLPDVPGYMEKQEFSQLLASADLVLGLSGTGNEQAAGCGLPVVSFYGRGSQYDRKFATAQKQLLGEALCLVKSRDPRYIAAAIWQLLNNPPCLEQMGRTGRERLGEPGALGRISAQLGLELAHG
ncbi:MAG: polysaccharide pyruvyl transferase family protein [Candidatus Margulisiibacteriota bacterium]